MKRYTFSTAELLRLIVLLSLFVALNTVFAVAAAGQNLTSAAKPATAKRIRHADEHDPKKLRDWWDSVGVLRVTITSVSEDRTTLFWKFEDTHEVQLGSFEVEERTAFPPDFWTKPEGDWIVTYCKTHMVAYTIEPVPKGR